MSFAHDHFNNLVLQSFAQGAPVWRQPWFVSNEAPINPTTGKRYKGINRLSLQMAGFPDNRFCTFKQAQAKNWKIRKGQKAAAFVVKWVEVDRQEDAPEGSEVLSEGKDKFLMCKLYPVFNCSQMDGPPPLRRFDRDIDLFAPASEFVKSYLMDGPRFEETGTKAYYSPANDKIVMPSLKLFKDDADWFGTLIHEIAHSTGAAHRMNREELLNTRFGSPAYAKEELNAELAAVYILQDLGLPLSDTHLKNHVSYIKHWHDHIKEDPKAFFKACATAEKIYQYVAEHHPNLRADERPLESPKAVLSM